VDSVSPVECFAFLFPFPLLYKSSDAPRFPLFDLVTAAFSLQIAQWKRLLSSLSFTAFSSPSFEEDIE
jgi:hypothetical protein